MCLQLMVQALNPRLFPRVLGASYPKVHNLWLNCITLLAAAKKWTRHKLGCISVQKKPKSLFRVDGLYNDKIKIPARTKHYQAEADYVFNQDVILYGLLPHMHYRGKSARFIAHYPDGNEELLLSVPNYNFNWQRYYNLQQPKPLPAGTRIVLTGVFDNSSQNSANPDPEKNGHMGCVFY